MLASWTVTILSDDETPGTTAPGVVGRQCGVVIVNGDLGYSAFSVIADWAAARSTMLLSLA